MLKLEKPKKCKKRVRNEGFNMYMVYWIVIE